MENGETDQATTNIKWKLFYDLDFVNAHLRRFCSILLAIVPLFLHGQIRLPKPAGGYCVGRSKMHWVDYSRSEDITSDPNDFRNVVVDVWYPGACGLKSHLPYLPPASLRSYLHDVLQDEDKRPLYEKVEVNYAWRSALADSDAPYPVLIFSPGGNIPIELYTSFFEYFGSQGYVILAVSHLYGSPITTPDGQHYPHDHSYFQRQWNAEVQEEFNALLDLTNEAPSRRSLRIVQEAFRSFPASVNIARRVSDVRFAFAKLQELNKADSSLFFRKLKFDEVVAIGHSFGGAVVGQLATEDFHGLRAVINMDGWQFGAAAGRQLKAPLLWIQGDTGGEVELNDIIYFDNREMYDKAILKGSAHQNFTDAPMIVGPGGSNGVGLVDELLAYRALIDLIESYIEEKVGISTIDFRQSIRYSDAFWLPELLILPDE